VAISLDSAARSLSVGPDRLGLRVAGPGAGQGTSPSECPDSVRLTSAARATGSASDSDSVPPGPVPGPGPQARASAARAIASDSDSDWQSLYRTSESLA
jgi:hypothetical protein